MSEGRINLTTPAGPTPNVWRMQHEMTLAEVANELIAECGRGMAKFPPFNSAHEGYAVVLEELDEVWDEVKANDVERAIEEMIQVGAMALRFIVEMRAKGATTESEALSVLRDLVGHWDAGHDPEAPTVWEADWFGHLAHARALLAERTTNEET